MSRRYDDPVEVRRRDDEPAEFLWRGRFYAVREVLARWVETGAWWQRPEVTAGERGSWMKISSGSSDHRSIATRPPSIASDSALPCSTVTGASRCSSMPLTRIAIISG